MTDGKPTKKELIFSKGCLAPEKHGALVAEIDKYAAIAGLGGGNMRYIWEPIEKYGLSDLETKMLKNIKRLGSQGKGGAIYVAQEPGMIVDRFMALTGCMVRNHVDARFMPLECVIDEYNEHRSISAAVACIPNFHTQATSLPPWRISLLSDLLVQHMSEGKLIVGYVENAVKIRSAYPAAVCDLLQNKFITLGGKL